MKLLLLFISVSLWAAQPSVTWTSTSCSAGIGYTTIRKDPVAGGVLMYKQNGGISIFATDIFEYSMGTGVCTHIIGTNSQEDTCPPDLPFSYGGGNPNGLPDRPGDRHPVSQQAVDNVRGIFLIGGGISRCSSYNITVSGTTATSGATHFPLDGSFIGARVYIAGTNCATAGSFCTVASVTNNTTFEFTASGPGTISSPTQMLFVDLADGGTNQGIWRDMYCLQLNTTATSDIWTRWIPAHFPGSGGLYYQGSWAYDTDDDILFHLEGSQLWWYASTRANCAASPTGTLSGAQTAAGAATPDDWILLSSSATPAANYAGFVYDPSRQIFWVFGGTNGSDTLTFNNLYGFNPGGSTRFGIASHAFKLFCSGACVAPPAEATNQSEWAALAFNSLTNTLLYHHARDFGGTANSSDWQYDPVTDLWMQLTSTGGSSNVNGVQIAFDAATNKLVSSGTDGTKQGQLNSASVISSGIVINSGKVSQ